MFHNSTTLHHNRNLFSATSGESRMVYELNWLAKKQFQWKVFASYMRGPKKLLGMYSWAFGWPLIKKGFDYTVKGMNAAVDGIEWTGHTLKEGALGALQMTAAPLAMLAKSRLTTIKRFLWDVPIATASAAIRMPIAIAKSPFEMVKGVRDAIVSVPNNVSEILNSVMELKIGDTLNNTRKAITDVLLPPITKPFAPILAPAGHLVSVAAGAELQTVSEARHAITNVIPTGARRVWNAPSTATGIMAEKQAEREAQKEVLEKEREEKKKALEAAIAENKGEAPKGGKGK